MNKEPKRSQNNHPCLETQRLRGPLSGFRCQESHFGLGRPLPSCVTNGLILGRAGHLNFDFLICEVGKSACHFIVLFWGLVKTYVRFPAKKALKKKKKKKVVETLRLHFTIGWIHSSHDLVFILQPAPVRCTRFLQTHFKTPRDAETSASIWWETLATAV